MYFLAGLHMFLARKDILPIGKAYAMYPQLIHTSKPSAGVQVTGAPGTLWPGSSTSVFVGSAIQSGFALTPYAHPRAAGHN